ncbi:MAG: MBL fold metallo-hydrolase [Anaerolineae bacterium]|nr:MBL fold metallo-hydrolase [Anaerolineae bacterium]MDW8098070.1 MBL fold metallo-hydrolase [Anaerolineae bacterium]
MKLLEHIYLVGSGGVGISDPGDCHVYLLDGGSELALVDAGCGVDTERILRNVAREGFDPARIRHLLLTHAHRDHAGGSSYLKALLARKGGFGLRLVASEPEARLLAEGSVEELGLDRLGLGDRPREETFPPCQVDLVVSDGDLLAIGDLQVQAIQVPGHNPGCLCYLMNVDGRRVLFAGDVVSYGGVISLGNWPGCDLQAYQKGLRKLADLKVDALLPGHLLWTLSGGQAHIDKAIQAFAGLWPPPAIHQCCM